jgi:hypothetical protein
VRAPLHGQDCILHAGVDNSCNMHVIGLFKDVGEYTGRAICNHVSGRLQCAGQTFQADAGTELRNDLRSKPNDAMNTNINMSTRKSVLRFVSRIVADAVLGATCGSLYGFVFGGIGALAQHESQRLIAITGIFALCGAIAGLALGASSAFSDADDQSADSTSSAFSLDAKVEKKGVPPVTAVRQFGATGSRRPQSRHVAV